MSGTPTKYKTQKTRKKSFFYNIPAEQAMNSPDKDGMYLIHIAIKNNDLGTLDFLINNKANINKRNKDGDTPLIFAIKEDSPQIVARLLEEEAYINKNDLSNNSPLDIALYTNNQECIDLLTEYKPASITQNKTNTHTTDRSSDFINELIALLTKETTLINKIKDTTLITQQIIYILEQYLNVETLPHETFDSLTLNINNRISQSIKTLENKIKFTNKDILNLARKIIVIIQDHKNTLSTNYPWTLNKTESLIEEKIVNNNATFNSPDQQIFFPQYSAKAEVRNMKSSDTNWYIQNGYQDFQEFIRINNLNKEPMKYIRFSEINKDEILSKNNNHDTSPLEVITIRPHYPTTTQDLSFLLSDSLKRIKEENSLFKSEKQINIVELNNLIKHAKKSQNIALEDSIKIDKILRPGKEKKIHIVHFHHNNNYEHFWNDLSKEAFLTGATIHLFNYPNSDTENDLIHAGIAVINKLLDEDIHPDKIILQGYGYGHLISREIQNQFQKREVTLTQINYQHPSFSLNLAPPFVCNHKNINICSPNIYPSIKLQNKNYPQPFSKFAAHITKNLVSCQYDCTTPELTNIRLKNYSLTQLINLFIKSTQNFIEKNVQYKNPALPSERVENIVGIVNV